MKKALYILSLLLVIFTVGCKKDDDPTTAPYATFRTGALELLAKAQDVDIIVSAYQMPWVLEADKDAPWCKPNKTHGDTTTTIKLTVEQNPNLKDRVATLTLKYNLNGSDKTTTMKITQKAEVIAIELSDTTIVAPHEGLTKVIKVKANEEWEITNYTDYPWITITEAPATYATTEKSLKIEIQPNTGFGFRKAELKFKTLVVDSTNTLYITQLGISSLKSDSTTLANLYTSCNGGRWTKGWDLTSPISTWQNLTIANTISGPRVTEVRLSSNNIEGVIPSDLANLDFLEVLWLDGNKFAGVIPISIGELSQLRYLYLFDNQLSGAIPTSFGNLNLLYRLHLSNNGLTGAIPEELGNLTNLTILGLNNNMLTGNLPEPIGAIKTLNQLNVSGNQLSGTIPATYYNNLQWDAWQPSINVCPQQAGYGFTNCK